MDDAYAVREALVIQGVTAGPKRLFDRTYVEVGDTFMLTCGYSEAACHLRIAGKRMAATLVSNWSVQLLNPDGTDFSFPITAGEAGVMTDYFDDGKGPNRHFVYGRTPVVNANGELVTR